MDWIDQQVETLRFTSRSHAIEYTLVQLMKKNMKDVWFVEDLLRDSIRKLLQTPKLDWLDVVF